MEFRLKHGSSHLHITGGPVKSKGDIKIVVTCEESQVVTKAFRSLGYKAYSNDLQACSGGKPEWHIVADSLEVLASDEWDLVIAHPPCTYLSCAGMRWLYHPDDEALPTPLRRPHPSYPDRLAATEQAVSFFMAIASHPVPFMAIENPVNIISRYWRSCDQFIQPYEFGHDASKKTGLWLKNLPLLVPPKGGYVEPRITKGGHKRWSNQTNKDGSSIIWGSDPESRRIKSRTYEGIGKAMAAQWGGYVHKVINKTSYNREYYISMNEVLYATNKPLF